MVQLARHDAMATTVAREEHDFAPGQLAGQKLIGRRPKRGFDFDPFLVFESFDIVEAAAADETDAIVHTRRG